MAKVKRMISPNNFYVYELDPEARKIMESHGLFADICDSCDHRITEVFYIPVLNRGICRSCYLQWIKNQYPTDEWDQLYEETRSGEFERLVHALKIELVVPELN